MKFKNIVRWKTNGKTTEDTPITEKQVHLLGELKVMTANRVSIRMIETSPL